MLTRKLGDVGKKIHSGRSRNDQVLVDLKLFTRAELKEVAEAVERLFHVLISQSNQYKDVLMPGYTHLQIAMPSSFGLWFGAYAESLVDDMMFLQAAFKMCNRNPLGSAAGYGSSFPLNREMTTSLLGFDSMNYNVVYAQMGRGKMERNVAFALASIAGTVSKMAFDPGVANTSDTTSLAGSMPKLFSALAQADFRSFIRGSEAALGVCIRIAMAVPASLPRIRSHTIWTLRGAMRT